MRTMLAALLLATSAQAQERPVIVADSYPMAWVAERLVGDAAEVRLAVPPGRDPASWRPTIAEIAQMQGADLIVLNGSGLADWVDRAALPRARTVDTGRAVADRAIPTETITHSHGAEGAHSHEGIASHTWLDLETLALQAGAVARALPRAVPGADPAALDALEAELAALDARADALVAGPDVPVIASHPRYEHLGAAYGLDVASLDWEAGAAPGAAMLDELAALAAETGAGVLIWEVEPPEEARDAVSSLGLAQAVVPPLSMPPASGDFADAFAAGLASLEAALARP